MSGCSFRARTIPVSRDGHEDETVNTFGGNAIDRYPSATTNFDMRLSDHDRR